DDPALHVDEIVVGVGKECRIAQRPRPLRGRVRRRYELRCDLARRAISRIIKGRQILLGGAMRLLRIDILAPPSAGGRATLVGVGLNQAGVDRKPFAANATLYEKLNFDITRDIAPIASLARVPLVMEINPSVPAKTVPVHQSDRSARLRRRDRARVPC